MTLCAGEAIGGFSWSAQTPPRFCSSTSKQRALSFTHITFSELCGPGKLGQSAEKYLRPGPSRPLVLPSLPLTIVIGHQQRERLGSALPRGGQSRHGEEQLTGRGDSLVSRTTFASHSGTLMIIFRGSNEDTHVDGHEGQSWLDETPSAYPVAGS